MCPILSAQNPTLSQEGFIKNEQTLPKQQPQKKNLQHTSGGMYSLYVFHFHGSQNRFGSGAVKTQSGNKTATAHI